MKTENYTAPAESSAAWHDIKSDAPARVIRAAWKARNREELEQVAPESFAAIVAVENQGRACYGFRSLKRRVIDRLLSGPYANGVECLGQDKRSGEWVYYCNAGDAYAPTILFRGRRLFVGCWGDLVERGAIRGT